MGDYEDVLASLETLNHSVLKAMGYTKKVRGCGRPLGLQGLRFLPGHPHPRGPDLGCQALRESGPGVGFIWGSQGELMETGKQMERLGEWPDPTVPGLEREAVSWWAVGLQGSVGRPQTLESLPGPG